MKFILVLSLAILACSSQAKEIGFRRFDGYQVLTVEAQTAEQFEILTNLYKKGTLDFWTNPKRHGLTDIMATSAEIAELTQLFDSNGMNHSIKIQDVEKIIDEERAINTKASTGKISWTAYPRWTEVEDWLLNEVSASPLATVTNIGATYEGRNMYAVKISSGGAPKKSILIDAVHHAREWISGATATWIINELITGDNSALLDQIDIYIIPYINIDGYEFTHLRDRLWRKTRSRSDDSSCFGCDPNRNYAFQWAGESTSSDPCSDIYRGPSAFSEPETQAVRDFVVSTEAEGVTLSAYLTFHSYGQLWLLPWGYTQGVYPPDYDDQLEAGEAAIAALRGVHNTRYETGQGADILYGVGGASDDWAKDHGIKYTTTVEQRDTGNNGFILPPAQIIPNAEEVWAAVQVYIDIVVSE